MELHRATFRLVLLLSLLGCEPPVPILAKLSDPVLSVERNSSAKLSIGLSYDTKKTSCGAVDWLRATFDGQPIEGTPGQRVVNKDGSETCEFPSYSVDAVSKDTPREIVVTDDITTLSMTVDTVDVGIAIAESPPPTLRTGQVQRWLVSVPAVGTTRWKVVYTPQKGGSVSWVEGTDLPENPRATVPPVTNSSVGVLTLSWVVNASVTKCEGVKTCKATIQGAKSFDVVVAP